MGAFLLFVCLLAPVVVLACAVRGRKRRASSAAAGGKALPLPPGSMGWPYVGETFQLYSSKNPNVFFARKQNRYGPIFKTHILGCPCVMVSSPEAARFVLVTQAHLFKPTFPASKERMLGPQAIFFQQGDYHAHLRRLVSRAFSPEAIRGSVPAIEAIALRSLESWDGRLVNTFQEMKLVGWLGLAMRLYSVMLCSFLHPQLLILFIFRAAPPAVRAECGIAVHLRRGRDAVHRGAEAVLPDPGEGVQLDAREPAGHPVPQGHEGPQAPGRRRGPHHRGPARGRAAARERPPGLLPGRPRGAHRRPDRRQRDRRHLRRPRHHRQRAHLDGQVPRRPPRRPQGRHRKFFSPCRLMPGTRSTACARRAETDGTSWCCRRSSRRSRGPKAPPASP
ncbi:abscisic acid 8'-hydroxylase1 [Zea mays]|uniref:Abscisic acid 8'-hydroxylase1 n=1 Tax=Zea mays TaxID=4577 RepID=A0A1D6HHH0_MAIZE|nr:abscisic acid 8'-hydroxylase1 [Zea mays]